MSIITAINAIQTINAQAGVSAPAWDDYSPSLTTAMLPLAMTWPTEHIITPFEGDTVGLSINVAFEAISRGSFDAVRQNLLGVMDAFRVLYRPYIENDPTTGMLLNANPRIELVPGSVVRMTGLLPNPESGAALAYPALEYWGFKITGLRVRIWPDGSGC